MLEPSDLHPNTQATLMLVSRLRQPDNPEATPLRPAEFLRVVMALKRMGLQPADLFDNRNISRLSGTGTPDPERVGALLARGMALSMALEKWSAQGIWVIGWDDADYPVAYKRKLEEQAPPILYGLGERRLLDKGGLAIVGSRDVDDSGMAFTRRVAESCAYDGIQVVSGAARGVDSLAMICCLEQGGCAVGILSDSLARQAVSNQFRDAIITGRLVLMSPFEPEARFHVASAMARNKLIYALADFALVISSGYEEGGTWAGAKENLNRGWVPLFVRADSDAPEGNRRLVEAGGEPLQTSSFPHSGILEWMRQRMTPRSIARPRKHHKHSLEQGTLPLS